jgi:hypothetical protein
MNIDKLEEIKQQIKEKVKFMIESACIGCITNSISLEDHNVCIMTSRLTLGINIAAIESLDLDLNTKEKLKQHYVQILRE